LTLLLLPLPQPPRLRVMLPTLPLLPPPTLLLLRVMPPPLRAMLLLPLQRTLLLLRVMPLPLRATPSRTPLLLTKH
jgi:hypothetical protein